MFFRITVYPTDNYIKKQHETQASGSQIWILKVMRKISE